MRLKKLLSLLIMVVVVLAATVPLVSAQDDTIRIGMVNLTQSAPYFIGMSRAVEEEAGVYENVELIITDANGDIAKLVSDVEDVLARDVDGVISSAGWINSAPAALDAIGAAAIAVVLMERQLTAGEYTRWIGAENSTIGVQNGVYLVERLNGERVLVILRGGEEDNTIGQDRTNGVLYVVAQPNIEGIMDPN